MVQIRRDGGVVSAGAACGRAATSVAAVTWGSFMSALDLDALVMAVLSAANNGWRLDDVPDGGVGVSFMLGMERFVLTVMANGAARLVDGRE